MGTNYFDSDLTEELIAKYKVTGDLKYRDLAMVEIMKIVHAIINLYRFWRFGEREDIQNEAAYACLKAIETFDPVKWKHKSKLAHKFFSNVVKKHLLFITTKESKYKTRYQVTDSVTMQEINEDKDNQWEKQFKALDCFDFPHLLTFLEQCLFHKVPKKLKIVNLFKRYITLQSNTFNKKEFINYTKSFGITHSYTRKILKEIEDSSPLFVIYHAHSIHPTL